MAIWKDLLEVSINNLNIRDYVTRRLNLQNLRWILVLVTAAHPSLIATKHKGCCLQTEIARGLLRRTNTWRLVWGKFSGFGFSLITQLQLGVAPVQNWTTTQVENPSKATHFPRRELGKEASESRSVAYLLLFSLSERKPFLRTEKQ